MTYQGYPAAKTVQHAIRLSVRGTEPVVYLGSGLDLLSRCDAGDGAGWYWGTDSKTGRRWFVFALR